jgi:hypothetical protein
MPSSVPAGRKLPAPTADPVLLSKAATGAQEGLLVEGVPTAAPPRPPTAFAHKRVRAPMISASNSSRIPPPWSPARRSIQGCCLTPSHANSSSHSWAGHSGNGLSIWRRKPSPAVGRGNPRHSVLAALRRAGGRSGFALGGWALWSGTRLLKHTVSETS